MKRNKPGSGSDYVEFINKKHHDKMMKKMKSEIKEI